MVWPVPKNRAHIRGVLLFARIRTLVFIKVDAVMAEAISSACGISAMPTSHANQRVIEEQDQEQEDWEKSLDDEKLQVETERKLPETALKGLGRDREEPGAAQESERELEERLRQPQEVRLAERESTSPEPQLLSQLGSREVFTDHSQCTVLLFSFGFSTPKTVGK